MLRIRDMDRDYKNNHLKMVERSRKVKDLRNIILPPISKIVNRINSTKKKNYSYKEFNNSYERSPSNKSKNSRYSKLYD